MSGGDHDPTDPAQPVVAGESVPPDEHTLRVRARREREAGVLLTIHDEPDPPPRTSTELAESSRRRTRRERDRRAERRALQLVVLLFLGLGGGAFAVVNLLVEDDPPAVAPPPPADPDQQAVVPPPPPPGVISTAIDETPNIPAFRHLSDEGLTIAAEGIPQVDALEGGNSIAALAALETCRFSYSVWELSPNKRFRFMTTCAALEGQVMFGAYEIDGAVIRMSPLVSDTDSVVSEFYVERPSKMVSRVSNVRDGPVVLEIHQKITAMRPGLDGDAWRDGFADKNTIHLPGERAPDHSKGPSTPPPPPPAKKGGDPLLELLKKNG